MLSLINQLTKSLDDEYRVVDAYRSNISPCLDCRYCWGHSGCAIKDEMQEIYRYTEDCNNVVIASPSVEKLNNGIQDQIMPRVWSQGNAKCIVCKPNERYLIALFFDTMMERLG